MSNRLSALKERISRLRLQQNELARLSGLDISTVNRAFLGNTDPLTSTLDKIEQAVETEERKLVQALLPDCVGEASNAA